MAVYDPTWWVPPAPPDDSGNWKWNGQQWIPKEPKLPDPPDPDPDPAAIPAAAGGSYGSSSSGSSGSASEGLSQYTQYYRTTFIPGGKPPEVLLKQAKQNNWTIEYFAQQVRLKDPAYLRSIEAKRMFPEFTRMMKILFPKMADMTKQKALMKNAFYRRTAVWYLRNGIGMGEGGGAELLYAKITNTKKWNKQNPYWKTYMKNADAAVQAEANPIVYKGYLDTLKSSFADVGINVSEDYYKTFFKSRYASSSGISDMQTNLKNLTMQAPSLSWFQGKPVDSQQIKTAVLGEGTEATDLRSRLSRSLGVQSSFLDNDQRGFGTSMDERGKLVKRTI